MKSRKSKPKNPDLVDLIKSWVNKSPYKNKFDVERDIDVASPGHVEEFGIGAINCYLDEASGYIWIYPDRIKLIDVFTFDDDDEVESPTLSLSAADPAFFTKLPKIFDTMMTAQADLDAFEKLQELARIEFTKAQNEKLNDIINEK
jgi:hypothetical protein